MIVRQTRGHRGPARGGLSRRLALRLGGLGVLAAVVPAPAAALAALAVETAGGRCVVPVLLDGRLARMVLDTGAERTVMNQQAARRLGLRRDLWVDTPMVGAGGRVETHPDVDVGTATLGGVALRQAQGGPLSLAVTALPLGGADGLLGADLLRHLTLALDMQAGRLRVGGPAPGQGVALLPWGRGLLLAPLQLDGQDLTALVDTGATRTLVNARGLHRLGLAPAVAARDPVVITQGLGGAFAAHLHRFTALQFGPVTMPAPKLLTAAVPQAAFDVILGMDVLGRQPLTLSYAALRLALG